MRTPASWILILAITLGCKKNLSGPAPESPGRKLVVGLGCVACHSENGSRLVGPSFKGMMGKTEEMVDGTHVKVDEAYVRESIESPMVKVVKGFSPTMPPYKDRMNEQQWKELFEYLHSLK